MTDNPQHTRREFFGNILVGDGWIWAIYILLCFISAVEIFSATSQLAYKSTYVSDPAFSHIKFLLAGLVVVIVLQSRGYKAFRAWGAVFYLIGVVMAFAVIFYGVQQKGAARSLYGIQPVEVCKVGLVATLCAVVSMADATFQQIYLFRNSTSARRFVLYLFLIGLIAVPIGTQNLSSAIIICLTSFCIMFLGKVNGRYLWGIIGFALIAVVLGLGALKVVYETHQNVRGLDAITESTEGNKKDDDDGLLGRSLTWANRIYYSSGKPLWEENMNGKKSQEVYSHMALVNGFPRPQFIGNSRLRDFLPEAFSDYIFAIIFEEWGLLGAILIMTLYIALFVRCYILSRRTEVMFIRLMMVSIPLIILIQALIHIGVNTGAMFVTGQPLPLISRGGSSIISTSIFIGVLLGLSSHIQQEYQERQQALVEPQPVITTQEDNEISD